MKLKVRITLANKNNESFMGIGLVWLLQRIKKFESINRAAKDMDMSYVKALRILNSLEKNLGKKILVRKIGGIEHGGAELTPFAKKFIDQYDRFQKKVKICAGKEFSKFVNEFGSEKK